MYTIVTSNRFLKDLKLLKKRSAKDFLLLQKFIEVLADRGHTGIVNVFPVDYPGKFYGVILYVEAKNDQLFLLLIKISPSFISAASC